MTGRPEGSRSQYESNENRDYWSRRGGTESSSGRQSAAAAASGGSDWQRNEGGSGQSYTNGDNVETHAGSYLSSSYRHDYGSQSRDNGQDDGTSGVNGKFKLYPRYRRETDSNGQIDLDKSLQCGPTQCTRIKCSIGPLSKDQEIWVAFRSRVWVQTLKKFTYNPEVQLSSMVGGHVTHLPHIGMPDQTSIHTHEVTTKIQPRDVAAKPEIVPLWVVVLSACAGAIILMLLVYLLYKCGFFKRNRPSDAPEKEPLNRNGHYQSGDEAL